MRRGAVVASQLFDNLTSIDIDALREYVNEHPLGMLLLGLALIIFSTIKDENKRQELTEKVKELRDKQDAIKLAEEVLREASKQTV